MTSIIFEIMDLGDNIQQENDSGHEIDSMEGENDPDHEIDSMEVENDPGPKSFQCNICEMKFKHKHHLNYHQKHLCGSTVQCQLCSKKFKHSMSLKSHMKRMHKPATENIQCVSGAKVEAHKKQIVVKTSKKISNTNKCPTCDFETTDKKLLKLHIHNVHNVAQFQCQKCKLKIHDESVYQKHVQKCWVPIVLKDDYADLDAVKMGDNVNSGSVYMSNTLASSDEEMDFSEGGKSNNQVLDDEPNNLASGYDEIDSSDMVNNQSSNVNAAEMEAPKKQIEAKTSKKISNTNKCPTCDFETTNKKLLKLHIDNEHNAAQFQCQKCKLKIYNESVYRRHVQKCCVPKVNTVLKVKMNDNVKQNKAKKNLASVDDDVVKMAKNLVCGDEEMNFSEGDMSNNQVLDDGLNNLASVPVGAVGDKNELNMNLFKLDNPQSVPKSIFEANTAKIIIDGIHDIKAELVKIGTVQKDHVKETVRGRQEVINLSPLSLSQRNMYIPFDDTKMKLFEKDCEDDPEIARQLTRFLLPKLLEKSSSGLNKVLRNYLFKDDDFLRRYVFARNHKTKLSICDTTLYELVLTPLWEISQAPGKLTCDQALQRCTHLCRNRTRPPTTATGDEPDNLNDENIEGIL